MGSAQGAGNSGWMQMLPSLIQMGGSLMAAQNKYQGIGPSALTPQQYAVNERLMRAAAEQAAISQALQYGMRDPRFRAIALDEEGNIRRDAIEAMQTVMKNNQRAVNVGRSGMFLNPERRDEARSKALLDAFVQAKAKSRDAARNQLSTASNILQNSVNALSPASSQLGNMSSLEQAKLIQQQTGRSEGISAITQALSNAFNNRNGGNFNLGNLSSTYSGGGSSNAQPWVNPDTGSTWDYGSSGGVWT